MATKAKLILKPVDVQRVEAVLDHLAKSGNRMAASLLKDLQMRSAEEKSRLIHDGLANAIALAGAIPKAVFSEASPAKVTKDLAKVRRQNG